MKPRQVSASIAWQTWHFFGLSAKSIPPVEALRETFVMRSQGEISLVHYQVRSCCATRSGSLTLSKRLRLVDEQRAAGSGESSGPRRRSSLVSGSPRSSWHRPTRRLSAGHEAELHTKTCCSELIRVRYLQIAITYALVFHVLRYNRRSKACQKQHKLRR